MKSKFKFLALSAILLTATIRPGYCDAQANMVRALAAKYKSSLVTLKLVVKNSAGFGETQSEMEADGILVSPTGLVATTNTAIDPMSIYSSGIGEEESGGMTSAVVSIKILTAAGLELPAKVVLRDKDSNMAFVRPVTVPSKPLPAINFSGNAGKARMGDPVYVLGRLGKAGGRNPEVKQVRIVSTIDKPRLRYVLDPYTYIYPGNIVFNEQGKPLGMLSLRMGRGGRRGSGSKPSDGFLSVVIPAADVWEVALQAPQAREVRGADANRAKPATKPAVKKPTG